MNLILLYKSETVQRTLLVCTQYWMAMPVLGANTGYTGLKILQQIPLHSVNLLFPTGSDVLLLKSLMHFAN